jgi:nitrile hydratase
MNGVHDMGGLDGFGPVQREANEPVFHAEWERRMFGIAATVPFTVPFGDDDLRREVERIAPVTYLTSPYYALWLRAISKILAEQGVLAPGKFVAVDPPLSADRVASVIAGGVETRMPAAGIAAGFRIGDAVRALNMHPTGHTRLPRYARGKSGIVTRDHGVFAFADSKARGDGPAPQHLYTVAFTARALWGDEASATDKVYLDLWESYLEPSR